MCLPLEDCGSQIFLTNKFVEMLKNDNVDALSCLVKIIIQFKELKEILGLVKQSKCEYSNGQFVS